MARWTHLTIVAAALAGVAFAQDQEPLRVKGLDLGATQAQFKETFAEADCPTNGTCFVEVARLCRPRDSRGPRSVEAIAECLRPYQYGGLTPIRITGQFDRHGGLDLVIIRISTRSFDRLLATMPERYGSASYDATSTVKNRMGVVFDNRRIVWERGDRMLVLTQRAGNVDEGSVFFGSKARMLESQKQEQQRRKDAAKDL